MKPLARASSVVARWHPRLPFLAVVAQVIVIPRDPEPGIGGMIQAYSDPKFQAQSRAMLLQAWRGAGLARWVAAILVLNAVRVAALLAALIIGTSLPFGRWMFVVVKSINASEPPPEHRGRCESCERDRPSDPCPKSA